MIENFFLVCTGIIVLLILGVVIGCFCYEPRRKGGQSVVVRAASFRSKKRLPVSSQVDTAASILRSEKEYVP